MSPKLLHGDCIEEMAKLHENSVDAIVTDPPYGLGFMGKKWDDLPPGPEFAEQALRVLKPGGHLLAFGGTRTYHRLACAIEDAGFEIRDCLAWLYGSGFPKSHNVGGAIDRHLGAEREVIGTTTPGIAPGSGNAVGGNKEPVNRYAPATPEAAEWQGWGTALKPAHEPIVLARKPLTGTVAANVLSWGVGSLNIDGCRIGSSENSKSGKGRSGEAHPRGNGAGGLLGLRQNDPQVEVEHCEGEVAADVQPQVPGQADDGSGESALSGDVGREADGVSVHSTRPAGRGNAGADTGGQAGGSRAPSGNGPVDRSLADEPRARPPHQRGQAGQPPGESDADGLVGSLTGAPGGSASDDDSGSGEPGTAGRTGKASLGRWPANVVLDEIAGAMLDEQSGEQRSGTAVRHRSGGNTFGGENEKPAMDDLGYGDSGGASRFFYCAKASRRERNAGLEGFEEQRKRRFGSGGRTQIEGEWVETHSDPIPAANVHPTVKPIALMRWLVRLVTPPNGTVLDPFLGSGTTGIAAKLEGFDFIGIEREAEYLAIAQARIDHHEPEPEPAQLELAA